jgi:hypothetical protein
LRKIESYLSGQDRTLSFTAEGTDSHQPLEPGKCIRTLQDFLAGLVRPEGDPENFCGRGKPVRFQLRNDITFRVLPAHRGGKSALAEPKGEKSWKTIKDIICGAGPEMVFSGVEKTIQVLEKTFKSK